MKYEYDFIEIGTADFLTLIEHATDETVGLSVEPVRMYLDRLPDKPKVKKICAAIGFPNIGDITRYVTIHYLRQSVYEKFKFPEWAKGCSSVSLPHPTIVKHLKEFGVPLDEGIVVERVPYYSFHELLNLHDADSVDFIKTDTEGHDCIIMRGVIDCINTGRIPKPQKISFESNELTPDERDIFAIRRELVELGYTQTSNGWPDTVMELL